MRTRSVAWMRSAIVRCVGNLPARLKDDRGVAALEFALIAPIMLGLYLSTVITTKAYMASRKAALVARSLADIASREQPNTNASCPTTTNPCVDNAHVASYFAAATAIMAPFPTGSLRMTLSRIDILQDSANRLWAFTKWSVTNNGGVARPCNGTNVAFTPPGTPVLTNNNSWYPLLAQNASVTTTGYETKLAPQYTMNGAPTGYLIVADVKYTYSPGFSFNIFNWSNVTQIDTGTTQAFWSRTSLPIVGNSTLLTTNTTLCAANDPSAP